MKKLKKLMLLLTACFTMLVGFVGLTACGGTSGGENSTTTEPSSDTSSGNENPHEHSYTNYVSDNNATCTEDGTKTAICDNGCGAKDTVTDVGSALGHDEKTHEAKEPTSTEIGWKEYVTCEREGCEYSTYEEISVTGILFNTLSVDGTNVYGKVSNTTTEFSFINEVKTNENAKFVVALDIYGSQQVATKTIPLTVGNNTVYIIEMIDEEPTAVYTVTVRRRPMYNVTFNPNNGTSVQNQTVEEDTVLNAPETTRTGYTLTGWDYDFTTPITQDRIITASWKANENTKYTVNYYLQNLDDDKYSLKETDELTGTTDTTATAKIKKYEHFTFNENESVLSGNIDGDGSRILSVYYTRNAYTLSINNSSAGSITNAGTYKFGAKEFTSTATLNLGYNFLGWYNGEKLLSTECAYTFTVEQNVTAMFALKEEMSNFNFTSTATTCEITGLKDKTVTKITVPEFVTSIGSYAFESCSNLTSVTIGDSVTSIGQAAFRYCHGLTSITIPDSVTSIVDQAFFRCDSLTSVTIGNSVTSIARSAFQYCSGLTEIVIPDSVTSIGSSAFENCNNLTEIVIPDGVTSIGHAALYSCDSLTEITLPFVGASKTATGYEAIFGYIFGYTMKNNSSAVTAATYQYYDGDYYYHYYIPTSLKKVTVTGGNIGEYTFQNCSCLTSVTIGNSVTSIGSYAFDSCSNLTSVTIGDSVTSIGYQAFSRCSSLTSIMIGDSVTSIASSAFSGCTSLTSIMIGDSVTSIASSAFSGCTSLHYNEEGSLKYLGNTNNPYLYLAGVISKDINSANISNNCKIIGSTAFYSCDSLTEIVIPDSVTSIDYAAFLECSSLTEIVIPDSVTSIGSSSFSDCSSLTSVTIGNGVTSIGSGAFSVCSSLTSVTISSSVTSIGSQAFYNCSSLTEIVIPDGVTSIGSQAFYNCSSLTEIVIPDGVTSIGSNTFSDCSSLTSVTIGYNVTSIGYQAFENCSSLTELVIPDSVTSIGGWAFENCSSLTELVIPNSVTSIGNHAFSGCSSLHYNEEGGLKYLGNTNNPYLYLAGVISKDINSANISNNCKFIGSNAFSNCDSLTELVIPDSVTSIGYAALYSCDSLTEITLPFIGASKTATGYEAVFGYIFGYTMKDSSSAVTGATYQYYDGDYYYYHYYIPTSLKKVTITGGNIGYDTFRNCRNLTEIVIPDGVTSIGGWAFYNCSNLTEIVIPDGVTSIGADAFKYCYNLTSVTIPDSVISINGWAFYDCNQLTSVYYKGTAEEWSAISINNYNQHLTSATRYYYSETQPTIAGNYWHYDENGAPVAW